MSPLALAVKEKKKSPSKLIIKFLKAQEWKYSTTFKCVTQLATYLMSVMKSPPLLQVFYLFDKFRETSELLRAVSLLVHDGSDSSRAVAELIRCGELCFL